MAVVADLSGIIGGRSNEQGLLSLTLRTERGQQVVYVYGTAAADGASVVLRYECDSSTSEVQLASQRQVLRVAQPDSNHNGGCVRFGLDGMLYVSLGDGGGANDVYGQAQDRSTLLGSLLRIDVSEGSDSEPYAIPADNPFVGEQGVRGEIYAYGLRNPWRFAFDSVSGRLWAGDVGQNQREEVDVISPGDNLGWPLQEGLLGVERNDLTRPIISYGVSEGRAVIGGFVYRGSAIPALQGVYVYGDFDTGRVWGIAPRADGPWLHRELFSGSLLPVSFAADAQGELLMLSLHGHIYRLHGANLSLQHVN